MQPTERTDSNAETPTVSHGSAPRRSGKGPAAAKVATDGHADDLGDMDRYLVHVAHLDLALPLKIELIRALRGIMQSFVDRAFGDDPVQQALSPEGKSIQKDDPASTSVVESAPKPNNQDDLKGAFRQQANAPARGRKKKP